ncbi:MAG: hypothetical protein WD208_01315 [Dehalococcoidia bacterium]
MPFPSTCNDAVACLWLPHFAWQAEALRKPGLKEPGCHALITTGSDGSPSGRVVLDHSPQMAGVLPGMSLNEAIARQPHAQLVEADPAHYEELFNEVISTLEQRVPDVEDAGPGLAYASLRGLERLYGDDANLVRLLASAIGSVSGFDLRIGVGPNKWLAHTAAATGSQGRARKVTGEPGRFLSALPVDLLPVSYRLKHRLHSFGLDTLGKIADLQRGAVEAQFGRDGGLIWNLANGFDNSPLAPRRRQEAVFERLDFPDATVRLSMILTGIEGLLSRAYGRQAMKDRYARRVKLEARIFRRPRWALDVAFRESAGSVSSALFGIKAKLDTVTFPGPLEDLGISLSGLTGEAGRQESMWLDVRRDHDLRESLAQMQVRLGNTPPIYQVREIEPWSRVPERRHALVQLNP